MIADELIEWFRKKEEDKEMRGKIIGRAEESVYSGFCSAALFFGRGFNVPSCCRT